MNKGSHEKIESKTKTAPVSHRAPERAEHAPKPDGVERNPNATVPTPDADPMDTRLQGNR